MNDEFAEGLNFPDAQPTPAAKSNQRKVKTPVLRKIIIDEVDEGENYEVVGVNGKIWQIKRGEEVTVPEEVIEVLKNAVITRWVKTKREDGQEDLVPRNASAVPWRLVG